MSVSSAQDEDWSIISSSSDLDDDLSLSYMRQGSNKVDSDDDDDEDDHNISVKSDANDTFDSRVLRRGSQEDTNQESSTITITNINGGAAINSPNVVNIEDDRNLDSNFPNSEPGVRTCGNVRAGSRKSYSAFRPFVEFLLTLFYKVDNFIKCLSAMAFDLTLGVILTGFRNVKESYMVTNASGMKLAVSKFLDSVIAILEWLEANKKYLLYTLICVASIVIRSSEVYGMVTATKQQTASESFYGRVPPEWKEFFDSVLYERGPTRRSFFGISYPGPKKLRVLSLYQGVRERSQRLVTEINAYFGTNFPMEALEYVVYTRQCLQNFSHYFGTIWKGLNSYVKFLDLNNTMASFKYGLQVANDQLKGGSLQALRQYREIHNAAAPCVLKFLKITDRLLKKSAVASHRWLMPYISKGQSQCASYGAVLRNQSAQILRDGTQLLHEMKKKMCVQST